MREDINPKLDRVLKKIGKERVRKCLILLRVEEKEARLLSPFEDPSDISVHRDAVNILKAVLEYMNEEMD